MEYDPKDNDVIHLLKKLKDSNGSYPQEMFALRRQGYLKRVAEISAGAGLAAGLRNVLKGGKSAGLPPVTGNVIEALLVVAIVAEAGAVTYFYRDKLAQYFRSYTNTPKAEEVSKPPVFISPSPELVFTPSPVATETETLTPFTSVTPVSTPSVEILVESTQGQGGNNNTGSSSGISSTAASSGGSQGSQPVSTQAPPNGNNGNHYGQTPLPVRTKEQGNNPNPRPNKP